MTPRTFRRRCTLGVLLVPLLVVLLADGATAGGVAPGPVGQSLGIWREQIHWVPMHDSAGGEHFLYTRICRPLGDGPARVVVINHGTPPDPITRSRMQPFRCDFDAVRWFLARGYIAVMGMRQGYGATGGAFTEGAWQCTAGRFAQAGRETARAIDALVTYATTLPYARPDGAVVIGHSVGGWGAIAYDSLPHPKVVAFISMAGGHGAHPANLPDAHCRPDELERAAGWYGATATTPMLWIYAANDSDFPPAIAAAMHAEFVRAGGKADLEQLGPFGSEGHRLFLDDDGSATWGPLVERYLDEQLGHP